jgi:hypothetical protein
MNGRLGKDQIGNLPCRNASVVDYCLSNVHFLERLVDLETLECSPLFLDVHTPFTLTLRKEHSHCEDADLDGTFVIANESSTEKVHLKFCKIILHLKATTPNCMIYWELGRYPLDIDIKLRNILYWSKLITGKDIKLSIISYRLLYIYHKIIIVSIHG